jgi:hypothetical protein
MEDGSFTEQAKRDAYEKGKAGRFTYDYAFPSYLKK